MSAFIMGALALCIISFLLAISVQLIRIERALDQTVTLVDVRVKQEFENR